MIAVVQRVSEASVAVGGREVAAIGPGMVVLVGIEQGDSEAPADALASKLARLRIFPDDRGRMNLDVRSVAGSALVVSQVTLAADVSSGNRPSLVRAADPGPAERLYLRVAQGLRGAGVLTLTGEFGAQMQVNLVNDGPVTLVIRT